MRKSLLSVVALALACSSTVREKKTSRQQPLPIQVRQGAGTVYALSKETGEYALHYLARSAALEDCWIYCNGQWVDIGVNETQKNINGEPKVFSQFASDPLTRYHIHPKTNDRIYPPSPDDIIRHGNLKRELRQCGIRLEDKVYDGCGEWTYTVTESVEKLLGLKNIRLHNHTFEELFNETLTRVAISTLDVENLSREKRIRRYIQEVSAFGVLVKYRKLP